MNVPTAPLLLIPAAQWTIQVSLSLLDSMNSNNSVACSSVNAFTDLFLSLVVSSFFTTLKENGLNLNGINMSNNYNEWRKLYKRKQILNDIFNM